MPEPALAQALQRSWYSTRPLAVLRPLGALYGALMRCRGWLYRRGLLRSTALPVPVLVVGNISVGGTGKTPLTLALAALLQRAGRRVGIASRGHGGSRVGPWRVQPGDSAAEVGDEPLLMSRSGTAPVCIARRRAAAAGLLAAQGCDLVLCDDGLQHLALQRQREIVVIDAARGLGNGACLPAGPLRESPARLASVDLIVCNGEPCAALREQLRRLAPQVPCLFFTLEGQRALALQGGAARPLADWVGQRVHAVAGIGHPQRFFAALRSQGLQVIEHAFPDHHAYTADDIAFADGLPVLMTSKDAVKCQAFAGPQHHEVPVEALFTAADLARLQHWLSSLPVPRP
jgi:tetraacyldisaccharide 4'-kinase